MVNTEEHSHDLQAEDVNVRAYSNGTVEAEIAAACQSNDCDAYFAGTMEMKEQ